MSEEEVKYTKLLYICMYILMAVAKYYSNFAHILRNGTAGHFFELKASTQGSITAI
jgi:hypothetical protein